MGILVNSKTLKGYLFEVIVIFIGITISFLFEEWREGVSDRKEALEYYDQILGNIKADSIQISAINKRSEWSKPRLEFLVDAYKQKPDEKFEMFSCAMYAFKEKQNMLITIESIQKSGKLGLIKNKDIINLYNELEVIEKRLNDLIDVESQIWNKYTDYKLERYPDLTLLCSKFMGKETGIKLNESQAIQFLADSRIISYINSMYSIGNGIQTECESALQTLDLLAQTIEEEMNG